MGGLRISGGRFRGRRLVTPRGLKTRPTSERVREALFSILGARVADARVADCFAGSGALGIEALSRGASYVDFYERVAAPAAAIQDNLSALQLEDMGRVIRGGLPGSLRAAPPYGLVLIDPPWGKGLAEKTLDALVKCDAAPGALVVVEERRGGFMLPEHTGQVQLVDRRTYGDTELSFIALEPGPARGPA